MTARLVLILLLLLQLSPSAGAAHLTTPSASLGAVCCPLCCCCDEGACSCAVDAPAPDQAPPERPLPTSGPQPRDLFTPRPVELWTPPCADPLPPTPALERTAPAGAIIDRLQPVLCIWLT